ncbi:MAG TPA: DinB family protein [bacterium]|nr:DinB family protein [bacterium]
MILTAWLDGLSPEWTSANEGPDTWSAYDIVGHLIHGEKTDWITRAEIILSDQPDKTFKPFDRFAQFEDSKNKTLRQLLTSFDELRAKNIKKLQSLNISEQNLNRTGIHPAFGTVTLVQLLSTWAVHDLDHISQIARVLAKRYKDDTGPWVAYLKILRQ